MNFSDSGLTKNRELEIIIAGAQQLKAASGAELPAEPPGGSGSDAQQMQQLWRCKFG